MAASFGLPTDSKPDLLTCVKAIRPTVLVGTSGQPNTFTEELVRIMAQGCDRPAIFPFSNPTSLSEATPEDLLRWTQGRALVATGSPFAPVTINGTTRRIGQGNNVYIFPGVGLGAMVARAQKITDSMFRAAAVTLANLVDDASLKEGTLYPPIAQLRNVSREIAVAVALEAMSAGVAESVPEDVVRQRVNDSVWEPNYPRIRLENP